MNKESYERVEIDVTEFKAENVIATSGEDIPDFKKENQWEVPYFG